MNPQFQNVKSLNISCDKKKLDGSLIRWPYLIETFTHQDINYQIRPIDKTDVEEVVAMFNNYYPHLFSSSRQDMQQQSFYESKVAMLADWESDSINKEYFIGVFEDLTNNHLAFAFGLFRDSFDKAIKGMAMVIHKDYRHTKLASYYVDYLVKFLEESGCDYVSVGISSSDLIAQNMAFKMGLRPGGIMPGAFRWSHDGEHYYRDMLIYFYKFCNGAEKYSTKPADWQLDSRIEHFRKLYDDIDI